MTNYNSSGFDNLERKIEEVTINAFKNKVHEIVARYEPEITKEGGTVKIDFDINGMTHMRAKASFDKISKELQEKILTALK